MPEGFKLDNADPPAPVTASNDIAKDEITVKIDAAGSTLTYVRDFHFGGGGAVLFPRSQYENLKTLWDSIDRADKRSILLKRAN